MKPFDPTFWYWRVAGSDSQVYSSVAGDYVPVTDADYVAWAADGSEPSDIDSEASLTGVLASFSVRPVNSDMLDKYQAEQADALAQSPAFKTIFYLMKQVAALQGGPVPTASDALALTKEMQ